MPMPPLPMMSSRTKRSLMVSPGASGAAFASASLRLAQLELAPDPPVPVRRPVEGPVPVQALEPVVEPVTGPVPPVVVWAGGGAEASGTGGGGAGTGTGAGSPISDVPSSSESDPGLGGGDAGPRACAGGAVLGAAVPADGAAAGDSPCPGGFACGPVARGRA